MKLKQLLLPIGAIALSALVLYGANGALYPIALANAQTEAAQTMALLLPGSGEFTYEAYTGEDENITAVYKSEPGYVVETTTYGYAGNIVLWVGVDNDGAVTGLVVRSLHETYGLGRQAMSDVDFLAQYLWTTGEAAVGEDIDAITGATVTSKAVTKGVNSACAFVTGADVSSSATEWGDW